MVMEEAAPPLPPLVTTTDFDDYSTTEDSSIVVLGKGKTISLLTYNEAVVIYFINYQFCCNPIIGVQILTKLNLAMGKFYMFTNRY